MNFQNSTKDLRDRSKKMARQLIVDYLPFEITREQINECDDMVTLFPIVTSFCIST